MENAFLFFFYFRRTFFFPPSSNVVVWIRPNYLQVIVIVAGMLIVLNTLEALLSADEETLDVTLHKLSWALGKTGGDTTAQPFAGLVQDFLKRYGDQVLMLSIQGTVVHPTNYMARLRTSSSMVEKYPWWESRENPSELSRVSVKALPPRIPHFFMYVSCMLHMCAKRSVAQHNATQHYATQRSAHTYMHACMHACIRTYVRTYIRARKYLTVAGLTPTRMPPH